MSWDPIIGLEIHLELATKTKMFCRCPADHFGKKPNSQTCPVCLGLPGALPYPNQKAIEWTVLLGLALDCQVPLFSKFDRKNYFYPDLPKGYQISQYEEPLTRWGKLKLFGPPPHTVRIIRVHLEEDTGRLVHRRLGGQSLSLIDFNRCGVPLVEVVSEPDIHSVKELGEFAKKTRQIVRYLKISEADMEKGQMRFELNLSMRKKGESKLPSYRVEVKNLNSFRFLEKAAVYEIRRQTKALEEGQTLRQETRGFDEKKQITVLQRTKEEAHDYRYFPEPDIPPISWKKSQLEALKKELPELADQKAVRFQKDLGLTCKQAVLLVRTRKQAEYFEAAAKLGQKKGIGALEIANLIINKKVDPVKLSPQSLVATLLEAKKKTKLAAIETEKIIASVIQKNPVEAARFKQGKEGLLQFFIGQVMKDSRGQADPQLTQEILVKKLKKF